MKKRIFSLLEKCFCTVFSNFSRLSLTVHALADQSIRRDRIYAALLSLPRLALRAEKFQVKVVYVHDAP
jgi:hypothetical protein